MFKSVLSKVAWVGRTASMVFGLALVLALLFGVATMAMGATGGNFILGKGNAATTPTSLISTLADAAKSAFVVQNKSGGPALDLRVGNAATPANNVAPMKVNSSARVANLNAQFAAQADNADKLDGLNSTDFAAANHSHSTPIRPFAGSAPSIAGNSTVWVFAGPVTQVTLSAGQRMSGSAVGVVALSSGTSVQQVNVGLCYQPSGGGTITNFVGFDDTRIQIGDRKDTIAAAASTAPVPGTYNVGFCVMNVGPAALSNNDWVNGWVMVTNN